MTDFAIKLYTCGGGGFAKYNKVTKKGLRGYFREVKISFIVVCNMPKGTCFHVS